MQNNFAEQNKIDKEALEEKAREFDTQLVLEYDKLEQKEKQHKEQLEQKRIAQQKELELRNIISLRQAELKKAKQNNNE